VGSLGFHEVFFSHRDANSFRSVFCRVAATVHAKRILFAGTDCKVQYKPQKKTILDYLGVVMVFTVSQTIISHFFTWCGSQKECRLVLLCVVFIICTLQHRCFVQIYCVWLFGLPFKHFCCVKLARQQIRDSTSFLNDLNLNTYMAKISNEWEYYRAFWFIIHAKEHVPVTCQTIYQPSLFMLS